MTSNLLFEIVAYTDRNGIIEKIYFFFVVQIGFEAIKKFLEVSTKSKV